MLREELRVVLRRVTLRYVALRCVEKCGKRTFVCLLLNLPQND